MKMCLVLLVLAGFAGVATAPLQGQSLADSANSSSSVVSTAATQSDLAFRMGNYTVLAYVGANIGLEFLYRGPHSFLSRMHLNDPHGAPKPGSSP
jgi:hypothetical protein